MGRGPDRPVKSGGPPHGQDRRRGINSSSSSTPRLMGRGPALPVDSSDDGRGRARAGTRPGPARHVFKFSRPGPAHQFFEVLGPVRPIAF